VLLRVNGPGMGPITAHLDRCVMMNRTRIGGPLRSTFRNRRFTTVIGNRATSELRRYTQWPYNAAPLKKNIWNQFTGALERDCLYTQYGFRVRGGS
jgi:hypothetical protein